VHGEDGTRVVSELPFVAIADELLNARNVLEDLFKCLRQSVKPHAKLLRPREPALNGQVGGNSTR
jgi:hypothetical protein